jgi:hypothetical protein
MATFLKPRFIGKRFQQHMLPLEVARDLVALEELLVELSRSLYLAEHPDRKRVPRGFLENFSLGISGIGEGSAVVAVERLPLAQMPLSEEMDYFSKARDLLIDTIATIAESGTLLAQFPTSLLTYFDRFGKSLREDEAIELPHATPGRMVRYDRTVRKELVLREASEYSEAVDLRGSVVELNAPIHKFTLKLLDGRQIQGAFPRELHQTAVTALGEYKKARVLVRGIGIYDRLGSLKRLEQITHVELLDPNDIATRLEELALLQDGWQDGHGKAPVKETLDWLENGLLTHLPADAELPLLFPTPEGEVQAEWSTEQWETSIVFQFSGRRAFFSALNLHSEAIEEQSLALVSESDWQSLVALIQTHL